MYYFIEESVRYTQGEDPNRTLQFAKRKMFRKVPGRKTLRLVNACESCFARLHSGVGWGEIPKNLIQLRSQLLGADTEWTVIHTLKELGLYSSARIAGLGWRNFYRFMKTNNAKNLRQCSREEGSFREQVARHAKHMLKRNILKPAQRAGVHAA